MAFEIAWSKQPPEVQQTKWTTTTGQLLERKTFSLLLPADCPCTTEWAYSWRSDPCSTYGHKPVTRLFRSNDDPDIMHIEYNYTVDQLSVRRIHCVESMDRKTVYGFYGSCLSGPKPGLPLRRGYSSGCRLRCHHQQDNPATHSGQGRQKDTGLKIIEFERSCPFQSMGRLSSNSWRS